MDAVTNTGNCWLVPSLPPGMMTSVGEGGREHEGGREVGWEGRREGGGTDGHTD